VFRRGANYICIPTTLIGLIDASVSIKVGVNHGKLKNVIGAYHAADCVLLDSGFLRTLPEAQVRGGFAELVKISACADLATFALLEQHCEALISHKFGRVDGSSADLKAVADEIIYPAIQAMVELEAPNLHEVELNRVIAYAHTWSPTLELAPEPPLMHGHAVSVDMAYSATLGWSMGLISASERDRIVTLLSCAGLAVDHHLFDEVLLAAGTSAILKTRDGKLRAAVPRPLGQCFFMNGVTPEQMNHALRMHKEYCKMLPRAGAGVDAYVDPSDR
jgi:3-dehydroquinate synthase